MVTHRPRSTPAFNRAIGWLGKDLVRADTDPPAGRQHAIVVAVNPPEDDSAGCGKLLLPEAVQRRSSLGSTTDVGAGRHLYMAPPRDGGLPIG